MNRMLRRLACLLALLPLLVGLLPASAADAPITAPQAIVDYLAAHNGQLPDNFITKTQAQKRGWDGKKALSDVLPGMSIGGGTYGNR